MQRQSQVGAGLCLRTQYFEEGVAREVKADVEDD
jgi:hypothetical protein